MQDHSSGKVQRQHRSLLPLRSRRPSGKWLDLPRAVAAVAAAADAAEHAGAAAGPFPGHSTPAAPTTGCTSSVRRVLGQMRRAAVLRGSRVRLQEARGQTVCHVQKTGGRNLRRRRRVGVSGHLDVAAAATPLWGRWARPSPGTDWLVLRPQRQAAGLPGLLHRQRGRRALHVHVRCCRREVLKVG